ncbi:EYxxD motif small membrane protein [Anoxybacteroides rupiense]|uniref:EYxxD motif small membrane protein n=1 Tax=Anoxybacteroides rupiense TaxID=311460 RepID=UPI0035D712B9
MPGARTNKGNSKQPNLMIKIGLTFISQPSNLCMIRREFIMLLEYMTDMSFVLATLIGSIVALTFVYVKKKRVR